MESNITPIDTRHHEVRSLFSGGDGRSWALLMFSSIKVCFRVVLSGLITLFFTSCNEFGINSLPLDSKFEVQCSPNTERSSNSYVLYVWDTDTLRIRGVDLSMYREQKVYGHYTSSVRIRLGSAIITPSSVTYDTLSKSSIIILQIPPSAENGLIVVSCPDSTTYWSWKSVIIIRRINSPINISIQFDGLYIQRLLRSVSQSDTNNRLRTDTLSLSKFFTTHGWTNEGSASDNAYTFSHTIQKSVPGMYQPSGTETSYYSCSVEQPSLDNFRRVQFKENYSYDSETHDGHVQSQTHRYEEMKLQISNFPLHMHGNKLDSIKLLQHDLASKVRLSYSYVDIYANAQFPSYSHQSYESSIDYTLVVSDSAWMSIKIEY